MPDDGSVCGWHGHIAVGMADQSSSQNLPPISGDGWRAQRKGEGGQPAGWSICVQKLSGRMSALPSLSAVELMLSCSLPG